MLELAVKLAIGDQYRCVGYCEREAFAAATIARLMQAGILDQGFVWDDLGTFPGRKFAGRISVLSAGLPCQPYSVAGKRKGHDDERAIWPAFMRIVGDVQPELVFIENVPGIVPMFRPIGDALHGMGYRFKAGLFSADEVGASQKRVRFFCLANRSGESGRSKSWFKQDKRPNVSRRGSEPVADSASPRFAGAENTRADCGDEAANASRSEQSERNGFSVVDTEYGRQAEQESRQESRRSSRFRLGDTSVKGLARPERKSLDAGKEFAATERTGLFPPGPSDFDGWGRVVEDGSFDFRAPAIKPGVRGMVDGIALVVDKSRSDQLRALGNGVVVATAAKAFRVLASRLGIG